MGRLRPSPAPPTTGDSCAAAGRTIDIDIDIDWEYPDACGATCDSSGRDAFRYLMSALRATFGSGHLVTAAITADATPGGKIDAADTRAPPRTSTGTTR